MSEETFTYPDGPTIAAKSGTPAAAYLAAMLNITHTCDCDGLEVCNDNTPESEATE